MNKFNIRKDLPSIRIDKEFISQLEKYILEDIPGITGIDKLIIQEKYSIVIVDTLGSGVFNNISEFPLSSFQDGTKKLKWDLVYMKKIIAMLIFHLTQTLLMVLKLILA